MVDGHGSPASLAGRCSRRLRPTRDAGALVVAPLVGALVTLTSDLVWRAWPLFRSWGSLRAQFADGLPLVYGIAFLTTSSTAWVLRRTGRRGGGAYFAATLCAGLILGMLLLVGGGLAFGRLDAVYAIRTAVLLRFVVLGCLIAAPSLAVYWILAERRSHQPAGPPCGPDARR